MAANQEKIRIGHFFEKNIDKVNWRSLCENSNIRIEFFEEHLNNVWWDEISSRIKTLVEILSLK